MSERVLPAGEHFPLGGVAKKLAVPVPPLLECSTSMFRLAVLDETTSTNEEIKRALEAGEPEGFAVRARRQTGGYGRQGRTWTSPDGGLYLSLLLRPCVKPAQLPTLSLAVSIAVRRALVLLEGLVSPDDILIKWPNDVIVSSVGCRVETGAAIDACVAGAGTTRDIRSVEAGAEAGLESGLENETEYHEAGSPSSLRGLYRKLCGISLEAHAGGICVGIGMNVQNTAAAPLVGRENAPVYLSDLGYAGSIDDIAVAVLQAMGPVYNQWHAAGFASFQDEYESYSFLTNRFAGMLNQSGVLMAEGMVTGVDECGCLLLQSVNGATVAVSSGEAHLR